MSLGRAVPVGSDGPGPDVVGTDGTFVFQSLYDRGSALNAVGAGRKARSKKVNGYLRGGLVARKGRMFAVCQARNDWLACLDLTSL